MKTLGRSVLFAAGVFLVGALFVSEGKRRANEERDRERIEELEQSAKASAGRARSAELAAGVLREAAVEAAQRAARAEQSVRTRVLTVRDTVVVPDTCRAVVAQRDSLLDDALAVADSWHVAHDLQRDRADSLGAGYVLLREAYDSTFAALGVARPRRSFLWSVFHPEVRPAVFAGGCQSGPCVGVGFAITLGRRE